VRRVLLGALAIVFVAALGFGVWARLLAGGPVGPIPGGALSGEAADSLPADWSFASREDYLAVESRAGRLPYSSRVWFMIHAGRIHLLLPSFFASGLEPRLATDPRVRIRLDGKLYDQIAVPVEAAEQRGAILAPFLRRQFAIEISGVVRDVPRPEGDVAVGMSVYRLEDPPPAGASAPDHSDPS
jgi:hypothetical protein